MSTRRGFLATILAGLGWRPSDELALRLAYSVLYDRKMYEAMARDADRGTRNASWLSKKLAAEHDAWIRGELAPLLQEYFRRAPWRQDSFPEYRGVLFP